MKITVLLVNYNGFFETVLMNGSGVMSYCRRALTELHVTKEIKKRTEQVMSLLQKSEFTDCGCCLSHYPKLFAFYRS